MTRRTIFSVLFIISFLVVLVSCKEEKLSDINIEQRQSPAAWHILNPRMGTIGLIEDGLINVYYLNDQRIWILDKVSSFIIPENNKGIIGLGFGYIGVIRGDIMEFFYLDARNLWAKDEDMVFVMPQNFDRIFVNKLPWEVGVIGIETQGVVEFYYLDERKKRWQKDETAVFVLPEWIDDYIPIGSMNIAVISNNSMGFYYLSEEGKWKFLDDFFLKLPEEYDALIPYEQNVIGVLNDGVIRFHEVEFYDSLWIIDETMNFRLPQSMLKN